MGGPRIRRAMNATTGVAPARDAACPLSQGETWALGFKIAGAPHMTPYMVSIGH